jgi:plasmid stabilization system protein ParE
MASSARVKVIWMQPAQDDVLRHWLFMAERDESYAERVEERLNAAAELLGDFPLIGRRVHRTTREWSVPDVQYVIRYRVDEDAIRILGVRHTRENRS